MTDWIDLLLIIILQWIISFSFSYKQERRSSKLASLKKKFFLRNGNNSMSEDKPSEGLSPIP